MLVSLLPQGLTCAESLTPPVVVFNPENRTGKLEYAWIGPSVSRYLAVRLLPALGVHAVSLDAREAAFESIDIPDSSAISRATMLRVAETVGAGSILYGAYQLTEAGDLQVSITPIDAAHKTVGRSFSVKGKPEELIFIENTIGYSLAQEYTADAEDLKARLLERDAQVPVTAYEYFIKGLAQEDIEKRIAYVRKATAAAPAFSDAQLELARLLYGRRDLAGALTALRNPSPEFADRFEFMRGLVLLSNGDTERAATAFTGLIGKPGLTWAALNNLAAVCSATGDNERASFYLENAIGQAPQAGALHFNFGVVSHRAGRTQRAVEALKEAARIDPTDWAAQLLLSDLLNQSGLLAESQEIRTLALKHAPSKLPELSRLADLRVIQLPDALQPPAFGIRPAASRREVLEFHLGRAEEYGSRERWSEAIAELKKVLYLDPYNATARHLLARSYFGTRDLERALIEVRMAIWSRDSAESRVLLARILSGLGQKAEAESEARRALELDPANLEARQILENVAPSSIAD